MECCSAESRFTRKINIRDSLAALARAVLLCCSTSPHCKQITGCGDRCYKLATNSCCINSCMEGEEEQQEGDWQNGISQLPLSTKKKGRRHEHFKLSWERGGEREREREREQETFAKP